MYHNLNRKLTLLGIATFTIVWAIILSCAKFDTNPFSDDYNGDYSLSAHWATPTDSLAVFKTYFINYKSTGRDFFLGYKVESKPGVFIDTTFFRTSLNDSQMTILCTAPFSGTINIIGMHPNLEETTVSLPVTVYNPFKLQGTKTITAGGTVTLSIAAVAATPFTAQWFVNDLLVTGTTASALFSYKCDTVCTKRVYALVHDTLGHFIATDTATISFTPKVPVATFLQDSLDVPVGQEVTISVLTADCDSIRWSVKRLGVSATTAGPLKLTFAVVSEDTIIATGFNRFGAVGTPDTLFVRAAAFNYSIQPLAGAYPDTIRARHWASWQVSVAKNGATISGSNIIYNWRTTPDSIWDSVKTNGDGSQLQIYLKDSIPPFSLGVYARIGTDSTFQIQKPITVRAFKPSCSFVTTTFQSQINQDIALSVHAEDANVDGGIVALYYMTSDATSVISTNGVKTWNIRFSTPGQKLIKAWAIDNEGFNSDTAFAQVTVTSNKPYFVKPIIDTSTFINDSISITVRAMPGNALDSIVDYQWDWDGDGKWDRTTKTGRIDTLFRQPGSRTWRVGCHNSRGDTAETLAVVTVKTSNGEPVIKTLSFNPTITYVGGSTSIRITASDTNGTVKKFAVKINGGADSILALRAAPFIDTFFVFTFPTPGKYLFSVAAIDDDSIKSTYLSATDSLVVSKGNPVMKGMKPDTVWAFDDSSYRITVNMVKPASSIISYFVKWDASGTFEQFADSLVKHMYLTAGKKAIRMYVVDKDNMYSDTISDSVVVLLGKPSVQSTFSDSVWIKDTANYKVRGTDANGRITNWAVSWESGQAFEVKSDSLFSHSYATNGLKIVKMFCLDDDNISSDTLTDSVYVKLGKPSAASVFSDSVWIYKSNSFKVRGTDPNGTVKTWGVQWETGMAFESKSDSNSTHAYATEGTKQTKCFVIDDDGISSDTVSKSVFVKLGRPKITTISVDTPLTNIYIRDRRDYTLKGADENDRIDSIMISWNGDTIFEVKQQVTGDSLKYNDYSFARSDSGVKQIVFRVKDIDGLIKDSTFSITVKSGAPIIDSISPSQGTWVRDLNSYTVYSRDLNGTVDSIAVDFNNDNTWDVFKKNNPVSWSFDTSQSGTRSVKVKVMDDDSIWTTQNVNLSIRLGRPIISRGGQWDTVQWVQGNGSDLDTMFYRWTAGNTSVLVDTTDTNGTVVRFDWDRNDNGTIDYLNRTSLLLNEYFIENAATKISVRGRDDDSLWSSKYAFWVYPDAPPEEPLQISEVKVGTDSVRLTWSGSDLKDGDAIQFKILCDKTNPPTTIVKDFGVCSKVGSDFTATIKISSNGRYYWKIIAKDARGSEKATASVRVFDFPLP